MTLTFIQQAIVAYLAAQPFFSGEGGRKPIPVIAGNDKNLLTKAKTAMASLGLSVVVFPTGGDFKALDASEPYLNPAIFNIRVRENILINRSASGSGQPADYVAEVCAQLLLHHQPRRADGKVLTSGGLLPRGLAPDEDEPGINAWNLIVHCAGGLGLDPVRLDFSRDGGPGLLPPP